MEITAAREQRIEEALFRGASLTLQNLAYAGEVHSIVDGLLRVDMKPKDLTVEALEIKSKTVAASVLAREDGVAAGLEEFAFIVEGYGISVGFEKKDGEGFRSGDVLLRLEGDQNKLLSLERVGLNLVQRMCGIATEARRLRELVVSRCPTTRVVGTRKTVWGSLDKRALHQGGVGTHRLGLGDAILVKNNHLALLARREDSAAPLAIARAWNLRKESAFIEVEVRGEGAAMRAAETFRTLQKESGERYPCLLLLDNMEPRDISGTLDSLRRARLWDYVLIEASGGINAENIGGYADTGVDAISVGSLTHSVRALDLCQRIS